MASKSETINATTMRRSSVMSAEDSGSVLSHSTDDTEQVDEENDDLPSRSRDPSLRLQLSRVSSTNAVGGIAPTPLDKTWTGKSSGTAIDPAFEIDFPVDDKANPQNWPLWYKCLIIGMMSYSTASVVLYSTSYTSAIPGMQKAWGISDLEGILGVTTYLLGMATGSVILAPLSEMYGRRPIYIITMGLFVVLVLPCALATNIATILAVRFLGAFCAAAMISNAPGTVNDIVDEEYRALAFSVWAIGPMNGPVLGPVVGGFVFQYLGWRWTNWVVMIVAAVAWVIVSFLQETYAPAILRKRAAKRRKQEDDERYWSRYDEKLALWPLLKVNLSRPFSLTITEPIVIFWNIYIALVYGILYLCFVAYPIVFQQQRGWSPGFTGLSFCGIGVGTMITILSEPLLRKWINSHKPDPETGNPPPEAMVSVVCLSAILIPVGEIWFAWTCTPNVHWIVPIIAGVPFGAGNAGVFIYASAYLVDSYDIYAASALASNAIFRCILGGTLPLAGPALYNTMGSNWAGTFLGLLEILCIPIPFVFYRYGAMIRRKSALIRQMRENKAKMDNKRRKAAEKEAKRLEAEVHAGFAMQTGPAVDEIIEVEKGAMEKR